MNNVLDIRKKTPQLKVVREVIFKRRPWWQEVVKVLLVIVVVTSIVWSVSKADDTSEEVEKITTTSNVGFYGTVISIASTTISLSTSQGDIPVDISALATTETASNIQLSLSDVEVGDKVIIQGLYDGSILMARRLISFAVTQPDERLTVATTTLEFATTTSMFATTTSEVATTTPETTSTTTPEVMPTTDTATTTEVFDTSTTTPEVIPTPEPEPTETPTSEQVSDQP